MNFWVGLESRTFSSSLMVKPFNWSPKVSHFRFFPASSRLRATISEWSETSIREPTPRATPTTRLSQQIAGNTGYFHRTSRTSTVACTCSATTPDPRPTWMLSSPTTTTGVRSGPTTTHTERTPLRRPTTFLLPRWQRTPNRRTKHHQSIDDGRFRPVRR